MTVSSNVRVLIATTTGDPVEIEKLFKLQADLEMSVACVGGGSTKASISDSYDHFVAAGSGIIEQHFGHRSWRLELSSSIDAGRSWQLGVFIAHELKNAGRLAERGEPADTIMVATGEVHHDVSVARIDGLAAKLDCLIKFLTAHPAPESHLIIAWPKSNQADAADATRQKLSELGATIIELEEVGPLIEELGVTVKAAQSTSVNPVAPNPLDEIEDRINQRLRQVHAEWTGILTAIARFLKGTIRALWIVLKTLALTLALTVNAAWKSMVVTARAAWMSLVVAVWAVGILISALAGGALLVWKYKSVVVAAAWMGCNFFHEGIFCSDLVKRADKEAPFGSEPANPLHSDTMGRGFRSLANQEIFVPCRVLERYDSKLAKCVVDTAISMFMPCPAPEQYDYESGKCEPSGIISQLARRRGWPDCSPNEHYDAELVKCVASRNVDSSLEEIFGRGLVPGAGAPATDRQCPPFKHYDSQFEECVPSGILSQLTRRRGLRDCARNEYYDFELMKCVPPPNLDPSPGGSKRASATDRQCPPFKHYDSQFEKCVPSGILSQLTRRRGWPDCSSNEHYDFELVKCVPSSILDLSLGESKGAATTDRQCPGLQHYNLLINTCVPDYGFVTNLLTQSVPILILRDLPTADPKCSLFEKYDFILKKCVVRQLVFPQPALKNVDLSDPK